MTNYCTWFLYVCLLHWQRHCIQSNTIAHCQTKKSFYFIFEHLMDFMFVYLIIILSPQKQRREMVLTCWGEGSLRKYRYIFLLELLLQCLLDQRVSFHHLLHCVINSIIMYSLFQNYQNRLMLSSQKLHAN